jgi:uncharacterized protein (DUF2141 family)
MNTSLRSILATAIVTAAVSACGAPPADTDAGPLMQLPAGTATLAVDITNVHSDTGTVSCALFNSATGFPGGSPLVGGDIHQPAATGVMHCAWHDLPAGTYAASVIHDENNNGVLDTSVFGAPTEGYGATNNVLPATSAPTFDANSVTLADGQTVTAEVTLHY